MLDLRDVHVYYGHIHALKGVSLEVGEGEVVALLGANGAGKSTALRAISGLVHPRSGAISFAGGDITRMAPARIVSLGIAHCPEGRQVFTSLTVEENLLAGAYRRQDQAGVRRDLEFVYGLFPVLRERSGHSAGALSGGQQQMLAIARALMSGAKLLLLDEPSLGLAPLLVQQIFGVIAGLRSSGRSILLVEQNAAGALRIANRAYVLETGQVVRFGPAAALRADTELRRAYLGG